MTADEKHTESNGVNGTAAQSERKNPYQEALGKIDWSRPDDQQRAELIAALEQWAIEDAQMTEEQSEANLQVLRNIDKHRSRKLFAHIYGEDDK